MRILLTIAWRNIRQHKTKTTIIGLIMAIGIMVLVVGNSLMDTATAGIEKLYIKNFTGHLMVTGSTKGRLTIFGYEDNTAMEQAVPRIPDYAKVVEFARSLPYVEAVNPQVSGMALVSKDDEQLHASLFMGIAPDQYLTMFPDNIEIHAGDFWSEGGEGILLNKAIADQISEYRDVVIEPGDRLLLTSISQVGGMKIREVEVTGIFSFKQSTVQLDFTSLVDTSNARALSGMVLGHVTPAELSVEEQAFLGQIDEESFFTDFDDLFSSVLVDDIATDDDYWYSIMGENTTNDVFSQEDTGAWQYLLIRLRDEKYLTQAQADFNRFFDEEGIPAQTLDWLQSAGAMAEMSKAVKSIFNVIVLIIAVVAIIIIMNTLVIAITERMGEIGTMRAIGAQKRFVRRMVYLETLLLSGISGLVGVIGGAVVLGILNLVGLKANNIFVEMIYGGKVLRPELSMSSVVMSLVVVIVVGIVSSTYPTFIVMRTSPLKAMESSR